MVGVSDWVAVTTILANVAAFLGIPMAIVVLIVDRRRARQDREQQTYQALQSEYSDFLRLCLESPELQLHDWHAEGSVVLSTEMQARRMVALEILVSMFESAFFLYHHGHHSEFKIRQWTGWKEYMNDWASRDDFRVAWKEHLGAQFDAGFIDFMDGLIRGHERPGQ